MGMIGLRGIPVAIAIAGLMLFLAIFGQRQYNRGFAAAEVSRAAEIAMMQEQIDSAVADTRRRSLDLEKQRTAARMLAMELDNEILRDTTSVCVPTDRELQRARDRWPGSD